MINLIFFCLGMGDLKSPRTVVLVARFYLGVTVLLRKYAMLGKWGCAHALLSLKCKTIK
jgi:uncharacterized RDD family membrane protein YckC